MASTHRKFKNDGSSTTEELEDFILKSDHPCIMAKTATQFERVTIREYQQFGSLNSAKKLYTDLINYINDYDFTSNHFESFLAVYPQEPLINEKLFESKLWKQLSFIHQVDDKAWDESVSSNPASPDFSFSIGGHAFYVIGLHPNSSRAGRRFKYPALVFNFHHQFEKLRELGTFKNIRDTIRDRDYDQNDSINPMLKDFGTDSEACQYSGRQVDETWRCPFQPK